MTTTANTTASQAGLISTMIDEWYFHADEHVKAKLADYSNVLLDRFAAHSADASNAAAGQVLSDEIRDVLEDAQSYVAFHIKDPDDGHLAAALDRRIDTILAAPAAPATGESGAEPVGHAGSMPGTDGFTMACFKAADVPIGTALYATPPAAKSEAASQPGEMGAGVSNGWKLVPVDPTPAMTHAGRYGGDPDAPPIGERAIEGETAWPLCAGHTADLIYRAMLAAASAQQDARQCTCGSGPGGGHSRTCLMFDESMMRYDPFGLAAQQDEREALSEAMREHLMAGVMALSEFQRDNPWVANTKALLARVAQQVQADAGEVKAWVNYPVIMKDGEMAGHGKPELSFKREAYGYDWHKAEALYKRPAAESDSPVAIGEFVCGEVEHGVDGAECGDYELIYTNKVLDEINEHHQGKSFGIYIDRAAMSREQSREESDAT